MAKIRILTVEFVFKTGSIAADAAAVYTYATLGSWHDGVQPVVKQVSSFLPGCSTDGSGVRLWWDGIKPTGPEGRLRLSAGAGRQTPLAQTLGWVG